MKFKNILFLCGLFIFTSLSSQNTSPISKGLIGKFTIEGTESTDMSAYNNGKMVEKFKTTVIQKTAERLKDIFNLSSVEMLQNSDIEFKTGLNKLKGVRKLDGDFKEIGKDYTYIFKIKCDISFDETVGGFLIDQTSSRARVVINVGVFTPNGDRISIYKGKAKDDVVFFGKNARKVQWLTAEDFVSAYTSALEELKLN